MYSFFTGWRSNCLLGLPEKPSNTFILRGILTAYNETLAKQVFCNLPNRQIFLWSQIFNIRSQWHRADAKFMKMVQTTLLSNAWVKGDERFQGVPAASMCWGGFRNRSEPHKLRGETTDSFYFVSHGCRVDPLVDCDNKSTLGHTWTSAFC